MPTPSPEPARSAGRTEQLRLERGTYREHSRLETIVTGSIPGGMLLLSATVLALLMANSLFADVYFAVREDRKSTRLNSSHVAISYAVFCLKKKRMSFYRHHDIVDSETAAE